MTDSSGGICSRANFGVLKRSYSVPPRDRDFSPAGRKLKYMGGQMPQDSSRVGDKKDADLAANT